MKASLIVPYREEGAYLDRMREMVSAQTFQDFEPIFVHDAEGRGPSWARNLGLGAAKGEIVLFADVDDEIAPDYVERLVGACEGVDLVWSRYETVAGDAASAALSPRPAEDGMVLTGGAVREFVWRRAFGYRLRDLPKALLPGGLWRNCGREFGSVWCRAFRRSAIGELRFDERIRLYEDSVFLCAFAKRASSMRVIDYAGYRYFIRPTGGMMSQSAPERKLAAKFALRDARRALDPSMSHWRGSFVLGALEVLRLGGFAAFVRFAFCGGNCYNS